MVRFEKKYLEFQNNIIKLIILIDLVLNKLKQFGLIRINFYSSIRFDSKIN